MILAAWITGVTKNQLSNRKMTLNYESGHIYDHDRKYQDNINANNMFHHRFFINTPFL